MIEPSLNDVTAVVLAGGLGKRIRHLAPNVPKPMIQVCGRPFVEWIVRYLRRQGVRRVVVACGFRGEIIKRFFSEEPVAGMQILCVTEPLTLGTGGGFFYAVQQSDISPGAWLVLNGDSLVLANLAESVRLMENPDVQGVLVGVTVPDAARYGTLRFGPMKRLKSFEEKRPGAGVINAGLYLFKPDLLTAFPPARPLSLEHDVFPYWLDQGLDFRVHVAEMPFLDIGTPESLPLAEPFIAHHLSLFEAS